MMMCPSANLVDDMPGGLKIFGIAGGTAAEPRVEYLAEPVLVTAAMLESFADGAIQPGEVFRWTKPCKRSSCRQWSEEAAAAGGPACTLIDRWLAALVPVEETALPACAIRPDCLGWHQAGPAACRRCPRIVSQWVTGLEQPLEPVNLDKVYL